MNFKKLFPTNRSVELHKKKEGGVGLAERDWVVPKSPGCGPNSFNTDYNNRALFSEN